MKWNALPESVLVSTQKRRLALLTLFKNKKMLPDLPIDEGALSTVLQSGTALGPEGNHREADRTALPIQATSARG